MSGCSTKLIAFNYFGGKFSFVEDLYRYFPDPSAFDHLIEPFMGSLVVSLNYRHRGPLIKTANDLNNEVVNFFQVLRDHKEELIERLKLTPVANEEYQRAWMKSEEPIEAARQFYVRIRQSFFGLGGQRQNKGWHFAKTKANSDGGETLSRWKNAIIKLESVAAELRDNYQFTNWDFKTCIEKADYSRSFFYLDPPYSKRSRASFNDYRHEFSDEQHEELASVLHQIDGLAMVSGYDCSLMNSLYGDWEKRFLTKKKNHIRSGEVQEVVWMNYNPEKTRGQISILDELNSYKT